MNDIIAERAREFEEMRRNRVNGSVDGHAVRRFDPSQPRGERVIDPEPEPPPMTPDERFDVCSSADLAAMDAEIPYLVEGVLAANQPAGIYGSSKTLKTSMAIDLTLSLAHGGLFLGKFNVPEAVRVGFLSGESGRRTISETANRIAWKKGWALANFENARWGFKVPRLGEAVDLDYLQRFICDNELSVAIVDPAYAALGEVANQANNLFSVGRLLFGLTEVGEATGATVILIHHLRKGLSDPFQPPELSDISWSGFAEWSRQWLLVGRREKYNAQDEATAGQHKLWLNIGGSAGHSSCWAVDITEGTQQDEGGRRWEVDVFSPSQARADAAADERDQREQRKAQQQQEAMERDRSRILKAFSRFPNGETKRTIRDTAGISASRFNLVFADIVDEGIIEPCEVMKAGRKTPYEGFKLTHFEPLGQVGQTYGTRESHR